MDLCTSGAYSEDIAIYLDDGAGNFDGPAFFGIFGSPRTPEFGDFNEDGNLDIVVSLRWAIDELGILFGDGTGAFDSTITLTIGRYPKESVVHDFNGDGHDDIATACRVENSVGIIFGDGAGSFSEPVAVEVGEGPRHIISGDIDGDGVAEIVTTNHFGNSLSILVGDGSGGFPYRRDFETGTGPHGLTMGDFDSDGKPDLAIVINGESRLSIVLDAKDDLTPLLASPEDGAILQGAPLFRWKAVPGADAYEVVLYNSADRLVWNEILQGRSEVLYEGPEFLSPGQTYRWSVREREQDTWKDLAPFFTFYKKSPRSSLAVPLP
jgi:hypothetical protein